MQVATVVRGPGFVLGTIVLAGSLVTSLAGTTRAVATHTVQAAVTADGFVVSVGTARGQHVTEVGRDGKSTRAMPFSRTGDVRVVGTSSGTIGVYEENKRIRLTRIVDEADAGMFGDSVRMMCQGVASNDTRFAVGWLESDDKFWYVHGAVNKQRTELGALELETTLHASENAMAGRKTWCGIASAESKVALLWRDRDRLLIAMCTQKKCGGIAGSAKFHRDLLVLGVGCLRNACLVASRDRAGRTVLDYITESGSIKWSKALSITATSVSIVGAGDRAFAVAYGNTVLRVEKTGKLREVWTGPIGTTQQQLAWSNGRLLIAHDHEGTVTTQTIELPR